jgi:hypothetical protein
MIRLAFGQTGSSAPLLSRVLARIAGLSTRGDLPWQRRQESLACGSSSTIPAAPPTRINLTVGFTTKLNTEALRLLGEKLMTVKIDVMDEDTFSDDK